VLENNVSGCSLMLLIYHANRNGIHKTYEQQQIHKMQNISVIIQNISNQ